MSIFSLSPSHYSIKGNDCLFGVNSETPTLPSVYYIRNKIIIKPLHPNNGLRVTNKKIGKISLPTKMMMLKVNKRNGKFSGCQKPDKVNMYFDPCFQSLKKFIGTK